MHYVHKMCVLACHACIDLEKIIMVYEHLMICFFSDFFYTKASPIQDPSVPKHVAHGDSCSNVMDGMQNGAAYQEEIVVHTSKVVDFFFLGIAGFCHSILKNDILCLSSYAGT